MKLILAIVSKDDGNNLVSALTESRFSVTKLATTGGFLRAGNITLIIGVEDEKVDDALSIIKEKSSKRIATTGISMPPLLNEDYYPKPFEITVGGAVVFVIDVEQFYKL